MNIKLLQFGIGTTPDGMFGPKTEKALHQWQKSNFLPQSKELPKEVEQTVFQKELEDMRHIRIAKLLLPVREQDIDQDGDPDNRSPVIDMMTSYVWDWWEGEDGEEGPPWCAIFISYIVYTAYNFEFKSPRVKDWYLYLSEDPNIAQIKSCDELQRNKVYIGGYLKESGYGHIFFLDPIRSLRLTGSQTFATIEGNTNDGGSRDGDGVYEREREFENYWVYKLSI